MDAKSRTTSIEGPLVLRLHIGSLAVDGVSEDLDSRSASTTVYKFSTCGHYWRLRLHSLTFPSGASLSRDSTPV
jgi:hypothetical protein